MIYAKLHRKEKVVLAQRLSLYSGSLVLVPIHLSVWPFHGTLPIVVAKVHQEQHLLFLATLWGVLETFWTFQITSLHFYTSQHSQTFD